MNKLRLQAEQLRAQGYSYKLINQKLGVPISTMSFWFRDKPFTPNQEVLARIKYNQGIAGVRSHNKRLKEVEELRLKGIQQLGELSNRDLWLLGLGIYIGEGAKTTDMIRISNSDPEVIRLSIRWLKEVFNLEDSNLAVRIHMYPDNDPEESLRYWKKVTGLSNDNFRRPSIDLRTNKNTLKKKKLKYGTAHVTVISQGNPDKGVRLGRLLRGWIYGALNQV